LLIFPLDLVSVPIAVIFPESSGGNENEEMPVEINRVAGSFAEAQIRVSDRHQHPVDDARDSVPDWALDKIRADHASYGISRNRRRQLRRI